MATELRPEDVGRTLRLDDQRRRKGMLDALSAAAEEWVDIITAGAPRDTGALAQSGHVDGMDVVFDSPHARAVEEGALPHVVSLHRTVIPEGISISLYITSLAGISCKVQCRVTDFSAGGARIRWTAGLVLSRGLAVKGTLIWLKGKEIPIQAVVKHRTKEGTFGIEFDHLDSVQTNRLKILSIEIQQLVNYLGIK
jgi:hypothetical protein